MPELPDLQAFSQNLQKRLAGKKVKAVQLTSKKSDATVDDLESALKGQTIEKVFREGKQLRIAFSNSKLLGLHLMLHGELHIAAADEPVKFSVFELLLDGGEKFVLSDFQKQARPMLDPEVSTVPDALSTSLDYKYLKGLLSGKKAIIKNVLLDQDSIRGIGNAYADEILWHARISPFSNSNAIPDAAVKTLLRSIRQVLEHAIKQILQEKPDIISGEIRDFLLIHQTKSPESPTGHKIEVVKAGARKTCYTEEQVLFKV
jgi:formamidopyrimidine-DNA glycosylase